MEQNIEKIKNILSVFFQSCQINNFEFDSHISEFDKQVSITVELAYGASVFIGKFGNNLDAFERLFTDILNNNSQSNDYYRVSFDINNYRLNHLKDIQELAKETAHKVMVFKNSVKLDPMSPRDRRIIHTEIALYPDLISESKGENPNRCVVISYRQ